MKVRFRLLTEMLGTQPSNEKIFRDYVASKNPTPEQEEQLGLPEAVEERSTTIFRRDPDGNLCLMDYHIKGALKSRGDAIRARRGSSKENKGAWGSIRGKLDDDVHVYPRYISLGVKEPARILERPLRAQTAQGPRVGLARSEVVESECVFECEIVLRSGRVTLPMLYEMLDEMRFVGLGQWRSASFGRAEVSVLVKNKWTLVHELNPHADDDVEAA